MNIRFLTMADGRKVQLTNWNTRIDAEVQTVFPTMPTEGHEELLRAVLPKLVTGYAWSVRKGSVPNAYGTGGNPRFFLSATTVSA